MAVVPMAVLQMESLSFMRIRQLLINFFSAFKTSNQFGTTHSSTVIKPDAAVH